MVAPLLLLTLAASAALWACETETTSTTSSSSGGGQLNLPDGGVGPGGNDAGGGPSGNDAGGGPGGNDAGGGTVVIPMARTVKLWNLSGAPVNACLRSQAGGAAFTTPAYRAAGIPDGALSERVITTGDGTQEIKVIAAGGSCADAALFSQTGLFAGQGEDSHLVLYYVGVGAQVAGFQFENLAQVAGKESVAYYLSASQEAVTSFDTGSGTPTSLRAASFGGTVLLDPSLTGNITTASGAPSRAMKTVSGGVLELVVRPTAILLCDPRAPAIDGLTDCSASVRAP